MNELTVIAEEIEEYTGEDENETINTLKIQLREALLRAESAENEISRLMNLENRIKELNNLCRLKNNENFALERKIKEMKTHLEVKDQQIVDMLSLNSEFKSLVESQNKSEQVDLEDPTVNELKLKLAETSSENERLKNLLFFPIEETQNLKIEGKSNGNSSNSSTPTKARNNAEPLNAVKRENKSENQSLYKNSRGGYIPSTLRRPKTEFM